MKQVTFKANKPVDRKEAFEFLCEKHNLDIEKQVKDLDITSIPAGYNVTIEKLFLFLYKNNFNGKFDFENSSIVVFFEEKPSTGSKAIKNPETISNTEVDEVDEKTPEAEPDEDVDVDDDDLPF